MSKALTGCIAVFSAVACVGGANLADVIIFLLSLVLFATLPKKEE